MGYAENMYNWLKRKGYAEKYDHAGIYCIKIDDIIVYIGKSHNMLKRVSQHYAAIMGQSEKKYRIFAEAQRKGHSINFDVLYHAAETYYPAVKNEIGQKEGEYIRQYKPVLNTQIPREDDWRKFDVRAVDAKEVLKELL